MNCIIPVLILLSASITNAQASEWIPPSVDVPVYYVTNRQPETVKDKLIYGKKRRYHNVCSYGVERTLLSHSAADQKVEGALWDMGWRGSNVRLGKTKPNTAPLAKAIESQPIASKREFFARLKAATELSPSKQLVVFVHGFNNSFESAAESAARLEASFKSPVLLFSWPSQHETLKYTSDECNVEWSWPDFRILLRDLDEYIGAENIILVGHSMGNRLVMWSTVSRADLANNKPPKLKSLVLSSPDIDAGTLRAWSALMRTNSDSNWVFISHKDIPLRLSRGIHGQQRAGGIQKYPKAHDVDLEWKYPDIPYGFKSIDFSNVDNGPLGHSIPYPNIESISREGLPAEGFDLKEVTVGNHQWHELHRKPASKTRTK